MSDKKDAVKDLTVRLLARHPDIALHDTHFGEPRIAGTRMDVGTVLTNIVQRGSVAGFLADFDNRYEIGQVNACLRFARDLVYGIYGRGGLLGSEALAEITAMPQPLDPLLDTDDE